MKTKIYIAFILLFSVTIISCNQEDTKNDVLGDEYTKAPNEEHTEEEHHQEGVVTLSKKQQKQLHLKTGDFKMRNLTTVVKINGVLSISPKNKASVTPVLGGKVKSIKVFQGDKVYKGQTLAVLEHPDYIQLQEEFASIAHNLDYLKQEYERQKELYENNATAGKTYQKAKTDYNIAKVKYEGLKSRLLLLGLSPKQVKAGTIVSTVRVVAPISGYLNNVHIKIGEYVDPKTEMFTLSDNSKIHADFKVYEKDAHLIKKGQMIHFTVANRNEPEYDAKIFAINKEFDAGSRSVSAHASITGNTKGLLPGMYITGHLHTDQKYVKTIPNDAIVTEGVKSFIFIVEEENDDHTEFKKLEIIKGDNDEAYTQVKLLDTLPENTKIVLNKAYYLLSEIGKGELHHEH